MSMKKKIVVIIVSAILICLLIGRFKIKKENQPSRGFVIEKKIDSLTRKNDTLIIQKEILNREVERIEVQKEDGLQKIKTLPLDSNINLLKRNLERYEKVY